MLHRIIYLNITLLGGIALAVEAIPSILTHFSEPSQN